MVRNSVVTWTGPEVYTWQRPDHERDLYMPDKSYWFYPARAKRPRCDQIRQVHAQICGEWAWIERVRLGRRRLFQKLCNSPCEWTVMGHSWRSGAGEREDRTECSEAKSLQRRGDQLGWAWVRGEESKDDFFWLEICSSQAFCQHSSDLLILVTALYLLKNVLLTPEAEIRDGRQPSERKHHRLFLPRLGLGNLQQPHSRRSRFYRLLILILFTNEIRSAYSYYGPQEYNALQKIRAMCNRFLPELCGRAVQWKQGLWSLGYKPEFQLHYCYGW